MKRIIITCVVTDDHSGSGDTIRCDGWIRSSDKIDLDNILQKIILATKNESYSLRRMTDKQKNHGAY